MSTHSTIAVQYEDGTIQQSFCHWDGYLEHNGKILVDNYNTIDLAKTLIALGSISTLAERIFPGSGHSYNHPEKGVTVFYGRDRGDNDTEPEIFNSYADYEQNGGGEEFNYLFRNGHWECAFDDKIVDVES